MKMRPLLLIIPLLFASVTLASAAPIAPLGTPEPVAALRVALACSGLAKGIVQIVAYVPTPSQLATVDVSSPNVGGALMLLAHESSGWKCLGRGNTNPLVFRGPTLTQLAKKYNPRIPPAVITKLVHITPKSYGRSAPYLVHSTTVIH